MSNNKTDIKADENAAIDRGEPLSLMEPLLISQTSKHRADLNDMAVELAARSAGLRRSLPEGLATALADLVRAMNCYYSNLIEGHDTHPVDIEKALNDDYSANPGKRDLQLEARAHIGVQQWIDQGNLRGHEVTALGLRNIHQHFCEILPDALLWIDDPDSGEHIRIVPGEFRVRDVKVGEHIPVSPGAVPRFVKRFEQNYGGLGKSETIIAAAAAHHRLVWIHPFLDGNGRVARLMSHAMLLEALDTGGIWSIARGLARNEGIYKSHLFACDQLRHGDLDGRGNLSEEALAGFTRFFLDTCLDQVKFMEELIKPDLLRIRILRWADEESDLGTLPKSCKLILEALLYQGTLPRGDVPKILGKSARQARRITEALTGHGVIVSEGPRAPWRLAFPAALAFRWMPGMFPEKID